LLNPAALIFVLEQSFGPRSGRIRSFYQSDLLCT
jgi:hypothetical protein